jgi:hypothetical protein
MVLPIYAEDQYRVYKLQPNLSYRHVTNEYDVTYHTNDQGLRTDNKKESITFEKSQSAFRVLFLGPSFAFGWANNYEDAYVSLIGKSIATMGKHVEVMNLGTPAQPIEYQLCWLQKLGYKFKPDLIIQTVYGDPRRIPNKCEEALNPPIVRDGYLYASNVALVRRFFETAKKSAIVFYGWYFYQSLNFPGDEKVGLGTELYESAQVDSSDGGHKIKPKDYLDFIAFVRKTLQQDIPVVFLHVPYAYVVRPDDLSRWKHRRWENPYVLRRAANELEKVLKQNDVLFVNPLNDLISKDKDTHVYYFLDLHFTPAGNRVLAEAASPRIRKMLSSGLIGE